MLFEVGNEHACIHENTFNRARHSQVVAVATVVCLHINLQGRKTSEVTGEAMINY